jgi:hypothetical protein
MCLSIYIYICVNVQSFRCTHCRSDSEAINGSQSSMQASTSVKYLTKDSRDIPAFNNTYVCMHECLRGICMYYIRISTNHRKTNEDGITT